ncbi:MAG: hypothetical protein KHW49_02180 [Eubacterium sp.]|nr:hypothetical protein [Eubacterium sp.]
MWNINSGFINSYNRIKHQSYKQYPGKKFYIFYVLLFGKNIQYYSYYQNENTDIFYVTENKLHFTPFL